MWLELKGEVGSAPLRHRDIVTIAVRRLARELTGKQRGEVLEELKKLKRES